MTRRSDLLRERRRSSNRLALIVFGLALGLLVLFGLGFLLVYLYQQGAAKVGGGGGGGPGGVPGLPGLPGFGVVGGEALWPQVQGRWKKPGEENDPAAGYVEFTADRRFRQVAPQWRQFGRNGPPHVMRDVALTRLESVGVDGGFRAWFIVPEIGREGYMEFKLVGGVLSQEVGIPEIGDRKTITYVKAR
jgi:hypothetical protein